MAEIYTKPVGSVQAAITLFEQKIDLKNCRNGNNKDEGLPESSEELLRKLDLYKAERDKYSAKFKKAQSLFLEFEKGVQFLQSAQNSSEMAKMEPSGENGRLSKAVLSSCSVSEIFHLQLDETEDLVKELFKQIIISEYLHAELKQLASEIYLAKSQNNSLRRFNSEKYAYILEIEEERKRLKEELIISSEKTSSLNRHFQMMQEELHVNKKLEEDQNLTSTEEHDLLIRNSKLSGELEEKNEEINDLKSKLEEANRRAELAEKAKSTVENKLRLWREQQKLRKVASERLKEFPSFKQEGDRAHENTFFSKLACVKPEPDGEPFAHRRRSVSKKDDRRPKYLPLGKLLKFKL